MGKVYERLNERQQEWIGRQKMFFVSTAPLSEDGRINCSPKGLDSFRILDDLTVAYIDLVGSGVETIAHIQENQRITFMFCAFEGPPKILRLYGTGLVFKKGTTDFDALKPLFPDYINERAIIKVSLTRIQDACGYAVPLYEFKEDRRVLDDWAARKGEDGIRAYVKEKNAFSLDGLPGM